MLQPLKNRILIERDSKKTVTESGFIIPEAAQEIEMFGTVLAIGSDVKEINIGDRVLFGRHDGVTIDDNFIGYKGDFILVREDAIRAVIEC